MLSTSTHVFSELFYHLNWHSKGDLPQLQGSLEGAVHHFIENYCDKTKGVQFFGVGGTEDHVHLVIQAEPTIQLSEWLGRVKGASSHEMNKTQGRPALQWQRGSGLVSFARRDLPAVLRYVAHQREHHQKGTTNAVLEQCGTDMEKGSPQQEQKDVPEESTEETGGQGS